MGPDMATAAVEAPPLNVAFADLCVALVVWKWELRVLMLKSGPTHRHMLTLIGLTMLTSAIDRLQGGFLPGAITICEFKELAKRQKFLY
jgi:hypothetical protein